MLSCRLCRCWFWKFSTSVEHDSFHTQSVSLFVSHLTTIQSESTGSEWFDSQPSPTTQTSAVRMLTSGFAQGFARDEQDVICSHLRLRELGSVAALNHGWHGAARHRQISCALEACQDLVDKFERFTSDVQRRIQTPPSAFGQSGQYRRPPPFQSSTDVGQFVCRMYEQGLNAIIEADDLNGCCEACSEVIRNLVRGAGVRGQFVVLTPHERLARWQQSLGREGLRTETFAKASGPSFRTHGAGLPPGEPSVLLVAQEDHGMPSTAHAHEAHAFARAAPSPPSGSSAFVDFEGYCNATARGGGEYPRGSERPFKYVILDLLPSMIAEGEEEHTSTDDTTGRVERLALKAKLHMAARVDTATSFVLLRRRLPAGLSNMQAWPRYCEQLRWCLSSYGVQLPRCANILRARCDTLGDGADADGSLERKLQPLSSSLHAALALCVRAVDRVEACSLTQKRRTSWQGALVALVGRWLRLGSGAVGL